jgi:hypothetical protein
MLLLADAISACGRSEHVDEYGERGASRTWANPDITAITFRTANGSTVYGFSWSGDHDDRPPLSFMTHRDLTMKAALKSLDPKRLRKCADATRAAAAALRYGIFVERSDLETASLALCAPEMREKARLEGRVASRPDKTHIWHTCEAPFTKAYGAFRVNGEDGVFDPPEFPMTLMLERSRSGAVGMTPIWNPYRLSHEPDAITAIRAMSRLRECQGRMMMAYRDLAIPF